MFYEVSHGERVVADLNKGAAGGAEAKLIYDG